MISLQGRLLALDPSANETLKVVSFFDSLTQSHAGVEAIVRAATALAGCAAGVTFGSPEGTLRVTSKGIPSRGEVPRDPEWPSKSIDGDVDSLVWIERTGLAHANDEMVLERLALSVSIAHYRSQASVKPSALETLIDRRATDDERHAAAARLQLDPGRPQRVVASPAGTHGTWPETSAVIWTDTGVVRASLGTADLPARAGIGSLEPVAELPRSWASALSALHLTDMVEPVLWADEVGALLMLDGQKPIGPDMHRVQTLVDGHRWAEETLAELGRHSTVRNVADVLGIHHSTLQARILTLNAVLEFDVIPQPGRTRMVLAYTLHRLNHPKL